MKKKQQGFSIKTHKIKAKIYLLSSIIFLSISCYILGILHTQTYTLTEEYKTSPEMQFVFINEDNTQYKIFQKNIHSARINWDFLFKRKKKTEEDKTENKTENKTGNKTGNKTEKNNGEYKIQPENKDYVNVSNMIDSIKNELNDIKISPKYRKCQLPRGGEIDHNNYILAYQQREDAPHICNIQKRHCKNGKLFGSYTKKACKEPEKKTHIVRKIFVVNKKDLETQMRKEKIMHSNKQNILIQSNHRPNRYDPSIIEKDIANTIRNNNKKGGVFSDKKANVIWEEDKKNCIAPRGDYVNHGQFIKAYKNSKGFNNKRCIVELRICLDGELNGDFQYKECTYIDKNYEKYYANPNNQDKNYIKNKKSEKIKNTTDILLKKIEGLRD